MEIAWSRLALRLSRPFKTSRAVRRDKETIWVKISDRGFEGWGEVVPMDTYGQTLQSAERSLQEVVARGFATPEALGGALDELCATFQDQLATVAGLDAAYCDWAGKAAGAPTRRLLGIYESRIPLTSFSLGIEPDLNVLSELVRQAAAFPILKVKLGTDQDEAILKTIRREAPSATIRVDANMAWTVERALEILPFLAEIGVEFVEQPLPAADLEGLRRLTSEGILPIVADESCVVPGDIPRVEGHVDGINIKLSKCGGIRRAHAMIGMAREAGLRIMLGCMVESSLGIAAALQLAPLVDWLDLDGHLLLADDPFSGIGGQNGVLQLPSSPGLGVFSTFFPVSERLIKP